MMFSLQALIYKAYRVIIGYGILIFIVYLVLINASYIFSPSYSTDHLSVARNVPSVLTMILFYHTSEYLIKSAHSMLLIILPVIACIGYFLDNPYLYGYLENVSTAMALPTAISFILLKVLMHDQYYSRRASRTDI